MASYHLALEEFKKKNYNPSLEIIKKDLVVENDFKKNSPNYNLRFLAAHLHWELNNPNDAIYHFKKCLEIKKNSIDPYLDLAIYQIELGQYNSAWKTIQQATKTKNLENLKESYFLYYLKGKLFLKWQMYKKAKINFEKSNSLSQDSALPYNGLGIALLHLKQYPEANTAFAIANELWPNSFEILNNLALSFEVLGKNQQAQKNFTTALSFEPENKIITENLKRVSPKN